MVHFVAIVETKLWVNTYHGPTNALALEQRRDRDTCTREPGRETAPGLRGTRRGGGGKQSEPGPRASLARPRRAQRGAHGGAGTDAGWPGRALRRNLVPPVWGEKSAFGSGSRTSGGVLWRWGAGLGRWWESWSSGCVLESGVT